ncbi:hypothetical protein [Sphingobium mellinum]
MAGRADGGVSPALPRLHHWAAAAAMVFAMMLIVPVLAGLT